MSNQLITHHEGRILVVEIALPSLMDPVALEEIGAELMRLVDEEDNRRVVLDFRKVEYFSSQAIGIVMKLHKQITGLKGTLIICGVNSRLAQLLQITRLDKILKVTPTQKEAVSYLQNALL